MNEEEIFNIQQEQLNLEIKKIKWIANNQDELIRRLRLQIRKQNIKYFSEQSNPDRIFRGQDIKSWIDNYIRKEINL